MRSSSHDALSVSAEDSTKDGSEEIAEEDSPSETSDPSEEDINVTVGSDVAVAEPEIE